MKTIIFFLTLSLLYNQAHGQTISSETISCGGESFTSSTLALSFTTGEIMSATYVNGGNKLMEGFQQQYYTYWTGKVSTAWNDLLNWKGGPVPGKNTDVIIPAGAPMYPIITMNAFCRSIQLRPATTITVATGFNFTITQ